MPVTPYTPDQTLLETSQLAKYPNPFFDLSQNYIPRNIKTLFKYCRDFYHTNGFLRNVVTKLTEYPVTDLLYDSSLDAETRKIYNDVLHGYLKIKSFLIEVGIDYFTFGNAFITTQMNIKRFLKCGSCNEESYIESVEKLGLSNFTFRGTCPACKKPNILFTVKDEVMKSTSNFKLLRLSPDNIDIEFNPISGISTYYYNIPQKIKSSIINGNRTILKDIPITFLQSLKLKRKIELDQNNLFHLKYPTLAEEDMGWGKPMILPALRDIYYLQMLRRGNEAVINEHLVPKKVLSPANTTSVDPFSMINMGRWRSEIENNISKWRRDPNHIAIMPIPIQYQSLGGDARMLMTTPEIRQVEESIINALGVPLEFIKGGTSWTGSSISLRIVENHFLNYRERLLDLVNHFILIKVAALLGLPEIHVTFKKFKMSDDSESKQLAMNLNSAGKISDAKLLDEFGYNYEDEKEALRSSRIESLDNQIKDNNKQAEAQGQASVINARYNARAQTAAQDEMMKIKTEKLQNEIARELGSIPEDVTTVIERYALMLINMPPDLQQQKFMELQQSMPTVFTLIMDKFNQYRIERAQKDIQLQQMFGPPPPPPNQKEIGQREQDKIKIREKEKTVGQKTGEP